MKTLITKEQYRTLTKQCNELEDQICEFEDQNQAPKDLVDQYIKLSDTLIEYEKAYHPLPGRVSTLITSEIKIQMQKHHLKQRTLGQKLGLSESRMSDLLRGKRPLSIPVLKKLHTELNIPADFLLTHC